MSIFEKRPPEYYTMEQRIFQDHERLSVISPEGEEIWFANGVKGTQTMTRMFIEAMLRYGVQCCVIGSHGK